MENQEFTLELQELQTGHFKSLVNALAAAMTRCVVWRYPDVNEKFNALQLYRFAEDFDKENPIRDSSFYMVSAEGAIGISPGAEYLTRWMFIPSMDEESVEKLRADIQKLQEPVPEPEPDPVPEPAPAPTPEPPVHRAKFCPNCGTPYKSDESKFCSNCGAPRKA